MHTLVFDHETSKSTDKIYLEFLSNTISGSPLDNSEITGNEVKLNIEGAKFDSNFTCVFHIAGYPNITSTLLLDVFKVKNLISKSKTGF